MTEVEFSGIDTAAVSPPPFEVMTGASLTLVMLMVKSFSVERPPESVLFARIEYDDFASKLKPLSAFSR